MGMTYDLLPESRAGLAGGLILGSAGLALAPLGLLAFALVERKAGTSPLLPPDVIGNPTFGPACIAVLLLSAVFFSILLYLPQFMVRDLGWSAVAAGTGLLPMEYAIAYPERVRAMILRDTAPDHSSLDRALESARNQSRVAIDWDNFNRYWSGQMRDNEDLKARWAEIIPLYDFEYDPVRSAASVEAGIYRYEAHNWCFQQNMPDYDLKPQLPGVRCPTLVTVGRTDWITPVSSAETIASLIPDSRLVIFEKSGHSPQIEEAGKFEAVVREFLHEVLADAGSE